MRKLLIYLSVLVLCGSALAPQKPMLGELPDASQFDMPVAIWLFNEGSGPKVYDLSGNGNDGAFAAVTPLWVPGEDGSALDFGTTVQDRYINCGHNPSLDISDELTIIAKVRPNAVISADMSIIGKEGKNQYWMETSQTEIRFFCGNVSNDSTAGIFAANTWVVVGVTYRNSDNLISYYKNGVLHDTDTGGDMTTSAASDLIIGVDPRDTVGLAFPGLMEYVMVFNRTLTASQIAQLYQNPFPWFVEDEIAVWEAAIAAPTGGQVIFINFSSVGYGFGGFGLILIVAVIRKLRRWTIGESSIGDI